MTSWYSLGAGVLLATALTACGGDSSDNNPAAGGEQVKTPDSLRLSFLSRYESGSFDTSAAEIPAYDSASQRRCGGQQRGGEKWVGGDRH